MTRVHLFGGFCPLRLQDDLITNMHRHYLFGDNQNRKFYDLSKLSGATGISIKSKGSNDSQEEEEEDD